MNAFLVIGGIIVIGYGLWQLYIWWQGKRLSTEVEHYARSMAPRN